MNELNIIIINIFAGLVASIILAVITFILNKPTSPDRLISRIEKYNGIREKIPNEELKIKIDNLISSQVSLLAKNQYLNPINKFFNKTLMRSIIFSIGFSIFIYLSILIGKYTQDSPGMFWILNVSLYIPFIVFWIYYQIRFISFLNLIFSKFVFMRKRGYDYKVDSSLEEVIKGSRIQTTSWVFYINVILFVLLAGFMSLLILGLSIFYTAFIKIIFEKSNIEQLISFFEVYSLVSLPGVGLVITISYLTVLIKALLKQYIFAKYQSSDSKSI